MEDRVRRLQMQLEEERQRSDAALKKVHSVTAQNGPEDDREKRNFCLVNS